MRYRYQGEPFYPQNRLEFQIGSSIRDSRGDLIREFSTHSRVFRRALHERYPEVRGKRGHEGRSDRRIRRRRMIFIFSAESALRWGRGRRRQKAGEGRRVKRASVAEAGCRWWQWWWRWWWWLAERRRQWCRPSGTMEATLVF